MPDWFYRTVAQRLLFRLPDASARAVALGTIGLLGRHAAGRAVIEFMGHMAPSPSLRVHLGASVLPSPVGLGWRVDPDRLASAGLSCFGLGCLEVRSGPRPLVRRAAAGALEEYGIQSPDTSPPASPARVPVLARQVAPDGRESLRLPDGTELPVVAWDTPVAPAAASGVVLQVGQRATTGHWTVPSSPPPGLPAIVAAWRAALPADAPLLVSGGVANPGDAVRLIRAGASLLLLDASLVHCGPGLIKRCNAALLPPPPPAAPPPLAPYWRQAWLWACALGAALALGGALTLGLAVTHVLLPYDVHYLGFGPDYLRQSAPRLFAFMRHDRGTLAGTMLGLGWLYLQLGRQGLRTGRHGTRAAVAVSALVGFASFFAFLGFGYFDSLHAFVAAVLFQFTIQVMVGEIPVTASTPEIDDEDPAWRRAQWGQLCWIVHAVGLLLAGLTILVIGMTSVFVREDINFLCLAESEVSNLGLRLLSVVAHDRATLGGMLLASGLALLLPVLWCFGRGQRWLWTALAGLGIPAYAAALGVHFWVGYTDWRHLVPALLGAGLWLGGLWFSHDYLAAHRQSAPVA